MRSLITPKVSESVQHRSDTAAAMARDRTPGSHGGARRASEASARQESAN